MLHCAMLCCAMLRCAMLRCAMLRDLSDVSIKDLFRAAAVTRFTVLLCSS